MNYQNNNPTVISTFSGCGGSSLGYKQAGYDVLLAVEMDNHAVETYKANFPKTKIYHGDIHNLSVDEILKLGLEVGELDLLDGSPPCQGFSTYGKREYSDSKNQLYHEYVRLLNGLQPKTFVMENVKGLIQGNMKLIFKDILIQLKKCGYDVKVKLMNAKYYNCATNRERLIFIGVRRDLNVPASHPQPQTKPIPVKNVLDGYVSKFGKHYSNNKFIKSTMNKVKVGESFNKYHPKGHYFGYSKINPNLPCRTLVKSGYSRFFKPDGSYLEGDEASLIQSFPKTFKWVGKSSQVFERVGNSVPPNLMKAIALHIKENILRR